MFAAEGELLEAQGHEVIRYTAHNDAVAAMGRLALARATIWNGEQYRALRALFAARKPDVVHVHNTLPLISPAVYDAAKREGAAVVQTLHNYRLVCPSGLLFRDGGPCRDCVGRAVPWPGVRHGCYRDSRAASAVVAAMLALHRARGTYHRMVDRYVALTDFAKATFVAGGLPAERIEVKPNFVATDPGYGQGNGGYALYVGRLSEEKGVRVLLDAWSHTGGGLPLRIVGAGPLTPYVAERAAGLEGVTLVGRVDPGDVAGFMRDAALLVMPSVWFEGMPMTILEAFAAGTPVVASALGAMAAMIEHGRTGRLFTPGDPQALAAELRWCAEAPERLRGMRETARAVYRSRYSAESNYRRLMEIYRAALED